MRTTAAVRSSNDSDSVSVSVSISRRHAVTSAASARAFARTVPSASHATLILQRAPRATNQSRTSAMYPG